MSCLRPLREGELRAAALESSGPSRSTLGVTEDSSVGLALVLAFMQGAVWYQRRMLEDLKRES